MPRPILTLDTECYGNYFLVQFYNPASGKLTYFELTDDPAPETDRAKDAEKVRAILRRYRIITFNGINYDLPLVFLYLNEGATTAKLKEASDLIIATGLKYWHIETRYGFKSQPKWLDHIDLIEIAPGKASLKLYGARMHCKKLQDLPIEPNELIAPEQRPVLRDYCANDLRITYELYHKLTPQIELREAMSKEYGVDLKSKSDAQIAEAVISKAIFDKTGNKPVKNEVPGGTVFKYTPPDFIRFETEVMNGVLKRMVDADYVLSDGGKIIMPKELAQPIAFFHNSYGIGVGGLHSTEECAAYSSGNDIIISDWDCSSFYPTIILNCRLYPEQIGEAFFEVYKKIVDERLAAKRNGNKTKAESLKIVANSTYGHFSNKYSRLYSPQLTLQVTLTGQLLLLMLIEKIEMFDQARVLSANTDGITICCRREWYEKVKNAIRKWESNTGFPTESVEYTSLYHRDVNNYIAIKTDGKVKSKGAYTPSSLNKNPTCEICVDAVIAYLKDQTPISQTIHNSKDFTRFIAARKVTGGAVHEGNYLGKTVRFYYRINTTTAIHYKTNGYLVPKTEGAWPCMELPDDFPQDIDYNRYINEAEQMLRDIGERLW